VRRLPRSPSVERQEERPAAMSCVVWTPAASGPRFVLCLQKFLEIQGRHVQFLSDRKFRSITDTLDALMKQRTQAGVGVH